ncbi:MAG TPA: penicillin-binding protein 2 [Firmicutes bacterium]|nr:penicillin-binding protein 2 [Bacillota bacterium]
MAPKELERRYKVFGTIVTIIFILLAARLWQLQIIKGDSYAALAEGNRVRLIRVMAPRGRFLDRNGVPLVASRMAFSVSIVPQATPDIADVAGKLARILGIDEKMIYDKINAPGRRPFEPVRLQTNVDPRTVIEIEEHRLDLPGVMIEEIPVRDYINGEFAAHLFGYIGEIDMGELKKYQDRGYRPGDIVGKTGLEKMYEEFLHGEDGGEQVEVNSIGRPIRVLGSKDPIPGDDIVLTIDANVQAAAERALSEELELLSKSRKTKNARAGAVIAIDPRNGEILAMVSKPGYDPNYFVGGITPERWRELNNPLNPLTNRVINATYPPGSTFKVITAIAALEGKKVTPDEEFVCRGRDPISKKACWIWSSKHQGHGRLNLVGGIQNSCNIVFYELGRRVGIDSLSAWAKRFGLGAATGIELPPGERVGLVPDRDWKRRNFKGSNRRWYPIETLDVAIGQGALSVTPLQLANVYVALANGGTFYRPFVVREILSPDGTVVRSFGPEITGHVDISESTLATVKEGLAAVVQKGTAAGSFRGFSIPVAGKTGTAENPPHDSHGWFAAFAPVDKPEIVVLVFVEHGTSGALAAAPVARKVLDAYFKSKAENEQKENQKTNIDEKVGTSEGFEQGMVN